MKSQNATRARIIEQADQLFYQQGFEHTSFANIAEAVSISRGNFYHHFKSKDAILDEVIVKRLNDTRTMLTQWEQEASSPVERIRCFILILRRNRHKIQQYGCPVGTLNAELGKLGHTAQPQARALFTLFREWLAAQFRAMGRVDQADELAMHVLAFSQGVAALDQSFQDERFVENEIERMSLWLDQQAIQASTITPPK